MRIAFLSQMGFSGKVSRTHKNMRVEFAQMCALGAEHFPLYWLENGNMPKDYDHIILLIPKTLEDRDRLFNMSRSKGNSFNSCVCKDLICQLYCNTKIC